jgi:hypothetical protein
VGTPVPVILNRHGVPDVVVAVFGSGRCDARLRGAEPVIAEAPDTKAMLGKLRDMYPNGFTVEFRDDPHM